MNVIRVIKNLLNSLQQVQELISLSGARMGIGIIFGFLMIGVSYNPTFTKLLFSYAILGFALTEAIALFGLMMAFLALFGD